MAIPFLGVLLVVYLGLLAQDRFLPARAMPEIRGQWRAWGVFFWLLTVVVNGALPYVLRPLIGRHHLLPGDRLGELGGAVLGFVVYDFFVYWLHRLWHRVPFLWRWVHQMHHAPERMDPAGMAFFHPIEIVGLAVTSTVFYGFVLGLTADAASLAGAFFVAVGMFQHSNLRTPAWLGYVFQRPEAHGLHHQRDVHAYNYSDLPLWDVVFGTFQNPERWSAPAGFYDGALSRWRELLAGRDVSQR
ncbi:MAG: sterol desaturase family protein [Archangiaceae bacterium]|nr:sterol desaturase family protein [Archangiaceae bacterium]